MSVTHRYIYVNAKGAQSFDVFFTLQEQYDNVTKQVLVFFCSGQGSSVRAAVDLPEQDTPYGMNPSSTAVFSLPVELIDGSYTARLSISADSIYVGRSVKIFGIEYTQTPSDPDAQTITHTRLLLASGTVSREVYDPQIVCGVQVL